MDFDDSGIDSDPKIDSSLDFHSPDKNEPIISFSPDRSRFNSYTSGSTIIVADTILSLSDQPPPISGKKINNEGESATSELSCSPENKSLKSISSISTTTDLQKRLEKRIARANSTSGGSQWSTNDNAGESAGKRAGSTSDHSGSIPAQPSTLAASTTSNSKAAGGQSGGTSSGFDTRKVPSLLPPQRLAIPHKSSNSFNEGSSSENKPLVQWDSDESEEELSFFPPPKNRGVLTDNLSIDNMSMSGEEDDLHLSPPRPIAQRCPCDPRLLFDSSQSSSSAASSSSKKNCSIV